MRNVVHWRGTERTQKKERGKATEEIQKSDGSRRVIVVGLTKIPFYHFVKFKQKYWRVGKKSEQGKVEIPPVVDEAWTVCTTCDDDPSVVGRSFPFNVWRVTNGGSTLLFITCWQEISSVRLMTLTDSHPRLSPSPSRRTFFSTNPTRTFALTTHFTTLLSTSVSYSVPSSLCKIHFHDSLLSCKLLGFYLTCRRTPCIGPGVGEGTRELLRVFQGFVKTDEWVVFWTVQTRGKFRDKKTEGINARVDYQRILSKPQTFV